MADALVHALANALVHTVLTIEAADDDHIDPDFAVDVEEYIGFAVGALGPEDRTRFVSVIEAIAEEETRPEVVALIRQFPEWLGLLDG